ncbi:MAG: hypothetical protein ACM3SY_20485 [Candidatus Omnitrophota bacterium]
MNLNGKYINVFTPKINEVMYGITYAEALPGGTFIVEYSLAGGAEKKGTYFLQRTPIKLCIVKLTGDVSVKLKETNYFSRVSYYERGADKGLPFTPIFGWGAFKNNTLIFTDGLSKNLKVFNHKGELVKEITTSLTTPSDVTAKDLDKWREGIKAEHYTTQKGIEYYKTFAKVIEEYKDSIYKKKPILASLSVTPAYNIIIAGSKSEKNNRSFWLIDEKGKILRKIIINAEQLSISKNFIFVEKMDEDDNEMVLCFKRTENEIQDFLRVEKELK